MQLSTNRDVVNVNKLNVAMCHKITAQQSVVIAMLLSLLLTSLC